MDARKTKLDGLRRELAEIRKELERLQFDAERAGIDERQRFGKYLDTLDRKQTDVVDAIDNIDDEGDSALRAIERGVQETRQRLAIAKQAAVARIH